MDDFLNRYRTRLKMAATQQLEETINKVFEIIKDDSAYKNTVIIIQARYQNLEQDQMRGIVAEPDRVLRSNQITNSLFELIDNLEITDLQESDDLLLNGYLKKVDKVDEAAEVDGNISGEEVEMVDGAEVTEGGEASLKSSKDLEFFSEVHRKELSYFPVIYRDVRSQVFKGLSANAELGEMTSTIEQHLPEIQKFKTTIDQLEPILKRIRVDFDKRAFWMKFQELRNRRTELSLENISNISKFNEELVAFVSLLEGHGIVKKSN